MEETFFGLRLLNSLFVAIGDTVIIWMLFRLLFLRSARLRELLLSVAVIHSVAAFFFVSPWSLLSISVVHDGKADWIPWMPAVDLGITAVWAGLASLFLFLGIRASTRGMRSLRGLAALQAPAPEALRGVVADLSRRLGIPAPRILRVPGVRSTPFVAGLRDPLLVMPAGLEEELTPGELEAVLSHELAHIARRDPARNFILDLVRRAFFFNLPLLFLVRKVRLESEKRCDAEASRLIGEPETLGLGLLKVQELLLGGSATTVPAGGAACSTLIANRRRWTEKRIRHLRRLRIGRRPMISVLQVALVIVLLPWSLSLQVNPVHVTYDPDVGGTESHGTLGVGAVLIGNPLQRWVLTVTAPGFVRDLQTLLDETRVRP